MRKFCFSLLFVALQVRVFGQLVIDDFFHPTGPIESFESARVGDRVSARTDELYSGLVRVTISGTSAHDDAFYHFERDKAHLFSLDHRITLDGLGMSYYVGEHFLAKPAALRPFNLIFSQGTGFEKLPSFNDKHEYSYILSINSPNPTHLGFGFLGGEYDLTVTPMAVGAVPEPAFLASVSALGLLSFALYRRRMKKIV